MNLLKEPRKKKPNAGGTRETVFIPLPLAICCPQDRNIQNLSNTLTGQYTAILSDGRVSVTNGYDVKVLYNCGYFGKGEYSRGEPSLNQYTYNSDEYSINLKTLPSMSHEKSESLNEWLRRKQSDNKESNDFHDEFMKEFVHHNVQMSTRSETSYYKTTSNNRIRLEEHEINGDSLFKTNNNPFDFKIIKSPNVEITESLSLMYEEAFFLCFGLDCLQVIDSETNQAMSISQLWTKFCSLDTQFPFKYAVYHKLRSRSWVIKYGLKYGCDFLVYHKGPDRYHASMSVRVKGQDLNKLDQEPDEDVTQFTALVRINETASKELMICYAIYDSSQTSLDSVECLKDMHVLESVISRWVPSANRQDNDTEILKTELDLFD